MTTLVNLQHLRLDDNEPLPDGHVYIGRPGRGYDGYYGNPRENGDLAFMDRMTILKNYRKYFEDRLENDPEFKSRIEELKDKVLVCFCAPEMCHGMIIIEYLDGTTVEDQMKAWRAWETERLRAKMKDKPKKIEEKPRDMFD